MGCWFVYQKEKESLQRQIEMWSALHSVENSGNLKALHLKRPNLKMNCIKRNTFIWKWLCWVYLQQMSWIKIIENTVKMNFRSRIVPETYLWTPLPLRIWIIIIFFHVLLKKDVLCTSFQLIRSLVRRQSFRALYVLILNLSIHILRRV